MRVGGTERALPLATDDERFLLLVDSLLFLSIPLLLCPRAVVALPRRDIGRPLLPVDLIFRSNLLLLPSPLDLDRCGGGGGGGGRYGGVEPSDSVVASVEGASVLFIPLAADDGARRHDMATTVIVDRRRRELNEGCKNVVDGGES